MSDSVNEVNEAVNDRTRTAGGAPAPAGPGHGVLRLAADAFLRRREATILLVAIGLMIYFQASTDGVFLSHNNLVNLSQSTAPFAIIAVGQVLLLVSGEIDLSAGATFTFAPFMMHYLIDYYGVYPVPAIILSVLVGAAIGFGNGFIVVVLKVPSFVATLGMLFLVGGITLTTSHAFPAEIPQAARGAVQNWFGLAEWSQLIWCLLIVVFFQTLLTRTRWGLYTIATGGNRLGAAEAGIRTGRIKIGNFMITGGLAAFAGILEVFRTQTIDPTLSGADFASAMFTAVSAAVIGGTALAGGSGTVVGALFGAFVLAELRNGFNLIGISANPFNIILGLAILLSMILNVYLANLRRAGRT
jgi:simple sugar transport system permease protein